METDRTAKETCLINDPSLKWRTELQRAQQEEKLNFRLLGNKKMAYIIHTKFVQNTKSPKQQEKFQWMNPYPQRNLQYKCTDRYHLQGLKIC